jgi:hypothetical protein
MMRKIHRVALAARLKEALPALPVAFAPASPALAKGLRTEKRFTFVAPLPGVRAIVAFEPAATAVDDYFTVDLAWQHTDLDDAAAADGLAQLRIPAWRDATPDEVAALPVARLRLDDVWTDAPAHYRGSFQFETASSRYCNAMFALHETPEAGRADRAFALLQQCMQEEQDLSPEQASAEIAPAVSLALDALKSAGLAWFARVGAAAGAR